MIISEMQSKLAKWSTENKERKFDRLLRLIANKEWLMTAANITLMSTGSKTPGVDGITKKKMQDNIHLHIQQLHEELLNGEYEPKLARRISIPKANGNLRTLGIMCLRDRIVQRAMLMAMEPLWESDFHKDSYGFRPKRSVHHAIHNIVWNLQDCGGDVPRTKGRWIIEGDLASYFDTIHHKILMRCIRKRISDKRFINLLWKMLKIRTIENNKILKMHRGVAQGAVLSPLLSNILLNEFDQFMESKYVGKVARNRRNGINASVRNKTVIALRENREWEPAVCYARFADDFVIIVKGHRNHAAVIRDKVKQFLNQKLNLMLNMDKTHLTHVNDGFSFLGHRIIRKRGSRNTMRTVTQIPREKFKKFSTEITKLLSSNYDTSKVDMIEKLNQLIIGWANFYCHATYTATIFQKLDKVIFWKLGHWLARKYKTRVNKIMRKMYGHSTKYNIKTWMAHDVKDGQIRSAVLRKCRSSVKVRYLKGIEHNNPYLRTYNKMNTNKYNYNEIAFI